MPLYIHIYIYIYIKRKVKCDFSQLPLDKQWNKWQLYLDCYTESVPNLKSSGYNSSKGRNLDDFYKKIVLRPMFWSYR